LVVSVLVIVRPHRLSELCAGIACSSAPQLDGQTDLGRMRQILIRKKNEQED